MASQCSVAGCQRKYYAKGWCEMHWRRARKHGDPLAGANHAPPEVRFWRHVEIAAADQCWPWSGSKTKAGYGRFQSGGKGLPTVSATRFCFEMHYGPVPQGHVVMHRCDSPTCVNPAHLTSGTHRDNTQDMVRKGRDTLIGERNSFAKLTESAVKHIRSTPPGTRGLTKKYGVSKETIAKVRKGLSWTHVKE